MILALKLGRTLEELGNSMSSAEFGLWLAVYREDLLGDMRAYECAGIVASTVANYAGMMRPKGAEPMTPRDFMPVMRDADDATETEVEPDPVEFFTHVAASKG